MMRLFPSSQRIREKLFKEYQDKKVLDLGMKTYSSYANDPRLGKQILEDFSKEIKHDLTKFPWPIEDDTFDLICCQHVIQHLPDTVEILEEFSRILKPKGRLFLEVPHYTWCEAYRHFDQCHHFSVNAFDYFLKGNPHYKTAFSLSGKKLFFDDLTYLMGVGFLANCFPRMYEKRLAFIFPAMSFSVNFIADK